MRITTPYAICMLSACILFSEGCKKTEQPVKMGQSQEPVCEPVHLSSAPVSETYIVMLRNAESQTGSVQTLGKASTTVNAIFRRYAIPGESAGRHAEYHTFRIHCPLTHNQVLALKAG